MSENQRITEKGQSVLIGNYGRIPISMARGEGSFLWDADGRRYIDLFAGFGGAILGHCHPALIEAITQQARKLWHVGNTFYTEPQIEFAELLSRHAFPGKAFFCHSGLEANEAACKLARLRGKSSNPNRWKIISLNHSFHGRSLAMIAATGNPKIRAGFEPVVPGFIQVEQGNIEMMEKAIDAETAGVIMEPIQGEGGIHLHTVEYVRQVRELCDRHNLTLIFDEVWTGCGRTGKWFGHQHFVHDGKVITPDVMTMAKAVGGGLPVGVMWARPEVAGLLVPGTHGCTLGANPVCMAVAATVFKVIEKEGLVSHAASLGQFATRRLRSDPRIADRVAAVRGHGLMLGVELKAAPEKIVEKGLERGVVINLTAQKVIRLAPAINISREVFEQGLELAIQAIAEA